MKPLAFSATLVCVICVGCFASSGSLGRAAEIDPSLPPPRGKIQPSTPNNARVTEISYDYQGTPGSPPRLSLRYIGENDARPAVYLGFNQDGSWLLGRWVMVLRGKELKIFRGARSIADIPDGLKNGGPFYLHHHPESDTQPAASDDAAAPANPSNSETDSLPSDPRAGGFDPNLPLLQSRIQVVANPLRITSLQYSYSAGFDEPPEVAILGDGSDEAKNTPYLGYNTDGSWLQDNQHYSFLILKGTILKAVPMQSTPLPSDLKFWGNSDPNLLPAAGNLSGVLLIPNLSGITGVSYTYPNGWESAPTVGLLDRSFPSGIGRSVTYLGWNEDGSWFGSGTVSPYVVLKGRRLKIPSAMQESELPRNLRHSSPTSDPGPGDFVGSASAPVEPVEPAVPAGRRELGRAAVAALLGGKTAEADSTPAPAAPARGPSRGSSATVSHGSNGEITLAYKDASGQRQSFVVTRPKFGPSPQQFGGGDNGGWIYVADDHQSGVLFNLQPDGSVTVTPMNGLMLRMLAGAAPQ